MKKLIFKKKALVGISIIALVVLMMLAMLKFIGGGGNYSSKEI
ncbi:hypothetical protein ACRE1U_03795 [Helicobacter himalayensis]